MITGQPRINDGTQLGSVLDRRHPDLEGKMNIVEWLQPKVSEACSD